MTRLFKRLLVVITFFLAQPFFFYAQDESRLPENIDDWIESSRQDWNIPGMAVGSVKDGKVIYAKGFGEKQLGSGASVDANTIFSIASVSKNMTAAALGISLE
nr:serine hydrolase domain-containing protein [uncultured Brumimicrobium sp.]